MKNNITYRYDIRIGHYVPLFEGEQPTNVEGLESTEDSSVSQEAKASLVNLDSADVALLKNDKAVLLLKQLTTINQKNSIVLQLQKLIADTAAKGDSDQASLNKMLQLLLQALKELIDAKFEYSKISNDMDNKIIQTLLKLVESARYYSDDKIPSKYNFLNESNIQNAKIYISSLIENDYQQLIKGMVDFKRAFKDSELLYGKDKNGFFAVCVDQADFNKLTKTLEDIGYRRDDIFTVCMPLIFDRSNLTK